MGWVVGWKIHARGPCPGANPLTEPLCLPKYEIRGSNLVCGPMTDTVENLILDLLEWVGRKDRSYQERWTLGAHHARGFRSGKMQLIVDSWMRPTQMVEHTFAYRQQALLSLRKRDRIPTRSCSARAKRKPARPALSLGIESKSVFAQRAIFHFPVTPNMPRMSRVE